MEPVTEDFDAVVLFTDIVDGKEHISTLLFHPELCADYIAFACGMELYDEQDDAYNCAKGFGIKYSPLLWPFGVGWQVAHERSEGDDVEGEDPVHAIDAVAWNRVVTRSDQPTTADQEEAHAAPRGADRCER